MNLSRFKFAVSLAVCGIAARPSAGAVSEQLREHSDRERQVRTQTIGVADRLDAVIAEFTRNNLGGADVATLQSIREVMGKLNRDQMQQVVTLLQQAADAPTDAAGVSAAKSAFLVQQDILSQFRRLLVEYQRRQGLAALADRIAKLADRQSTNLRSAVDLAVAKAGKDANTTDAVSQAQQSEQSDIAADAADAVAAARVMARDTSGDAAVRLNHALSDANTATALVSAKAAAGDLQIGNFYRAAGDEKSARDALRTLAEQLAPPKDALDEKKQQLAALDALSDRQQDLLDRTTAPPDNTAPDHQPYRPIARDQAAAVDATDDAKRKLANISPKAAAALDHAEDHMQAARGSLNAKNARPAADEQIKAKADVDEARRQLQQEIAAAPSNDPAAADASPTTGPSGLPPDAVATAKEVVERIKNLRQAQENASHDTPSRLIPKDQKADRQQSIADETQQVQQATADTPTAADPLAQAAREMQQASAALQKSNAAAASQQQHAAEESLAKAQSAAEAKVTDLQQAQQQLDDLQKVQKQIAQLSQQQAELATTPETTATATKGDSQQQLANQTTQMRSNLPASAKAAADPLAQAAGHMRDASDQLKNTADDARLSQGKAIGSLAEAAAKIDQAMNEANARLGRAPDDQAAEKATASAVDEAAKQLQKAQAALAQAGQPGAEKDLRSAAASAAKAMMEGRDAEQNAQLQQAIGEMSKAAADAGQQKPEPARAEAAKAAAAIARAQSSMPSLAQTNRPQQDPVKPQDTPAADSDSAAAKNRDAQDNGSHDSVNGANSFVQLPARDRAALAQSQGEKYPQEYGPLVEQYLRNLSDASGK